MNRFDCDSRNNDFMIVNTSGNSVLFLTVTEPGKLTKSTSELLLDNYEKVEKMRDLLNEWLDRNHV